MRDQGVTFSRRHGYSRLQRLTPMSRLRPLSSALLSFGLLLAGQSALSLPVAGATPEPGAGQTPTPAPPAAAVRPQNWGRCSQFLTDSSAEFNGLRRGMAVNRCSFEYPCQREKVTP